MLSKPPRTWLLTLVGLAPLASGRADTIPPQVKGQSQALVGSHAFINELHYDNAATDVGEAIEVAGPAGTVPPPPSLPVDQCGDPVTAIAAVQGASDASPLAGTEVSIEGVVVGDYQDGLNGFFLQDPVGDGDPATSEGLFVFEGSSNMAVAPFDRVRVRGTVTEYFGLTELTNVAFVGVCERGQSVSPTEVRLPVSEVSDLEAFEGMLVHFPQTLTATEVYDLGRYGEVGLSVGGRLFNATNVPFASPDDIASIEAESARRRILLDDARSGQGLEPAPYVGVDGTLRLGDTVQGVTAVLSYGFDKYRLEPVDVPAFTRANARETAPAEVGGNLRLATFNVLNYFTTLNQRGADSPEELDRQAAKLIAALTVLDADIVALSELENGSSAVEDLVARLNAALGADVYTAVDPGTIGDDAIRVGLIYKHAQVAPAGASRVISFEGLEDPTNVLGDRPSLAQIFAFGGEQLTVVSSHFKSRGCDDAAGASQERGQGCWNPRRVASAQAVLDALATIAAETGDPDAIVLGDLNAYAYEDPILALEDGGLTNLSKTFVPDQERYSYVFFGEAGELDHAFATRSLAARVTGATIWHINADEPRLLDYNTELNPSSAYAPDPFRASDHDPIVVGLQIGTDPEALLADLLTAVVQSRVGPLCTLVLTTGLRAASAWLELGFEGRAVTALGRFVNRVKLMRARRQLPAEEAARFLMAADELIARLSS